MLEISYNKLDGQECKVKIPISWRDLTWDKYVELTYTKFDNEVHKLAWLTGIEIQVLLTNPLFLKALIDSCSFIWDEDIEIYSNLVKPEHKKLIEDMNISALEWGKFEAAKSEIQRAGEDINKAAKGIIKTYLDLEVGQLPCIEVIGLTAFFLRKFTTS